MTTPTITLNNGIAIPQLGLGVWQASPEDTERIVRFAIDEAGYRHIDGAKIYANEEAVGKAVRESSVPREEVFVTTKLWNDDHGRAKPLAAIDGSLARLGFDYVDLYLIHWPLQDAAELAQTWLAMEEILASGKARAIGVSNHEPHHLKVVLGAGSVVPAVNQIELHPRLAQQELRAFDAAHGIASESWSALGGRSRSATARGVEPNAELSDPTIAAIAAKHGKTPAQVVIRWHLQHGLVVIPKSVHEERVRENIDVFGFELDTEDLAAIAALDLPDGAGRVGAHPDTV